MFDVIVPLLCLYRISFLLLLHLYRFSRFSFLYLFSLLLYILLSYVLLFFSLYSYLLYLLLGCLLVSSRSDVLQLCPFSLVFLLPNLYTNPLPALTTIYIVKLLAYVVTRSFDIAIYIGV